MEIVLNQGQLLNNEEMVLFAYCKVSALKGFYCCLCIVAPIVCGSMCGSRNFVRGGGGGGSRSDSRNTALTTFFFFFLHSPQFILQFTDGVQWFYYRENYTFPRIQRRSNIFQGVQLFLGGVQMLISIETHITCDFPGGGPDSLSPLWIRTWVFLFGPCFVVQYLVSLLDFGSFTFNRLLAVM